MGLISNVLSNLAYRRWSFGTRVRRSLISSFTRNVQRFTNLVHYSAVKPIRTEKGNLHKKMGFWVKTAWEGGEGRVNLPLAIIHSESVGNFDLAAVGFILSTVFTVQHCIWFDLSHHQGNLWKIMNKITFILKKVSYFLVKYFVWDVVKMNISSDQTRHAYSKQI